MEPLIQTEAMAKRYELDGVGVQALDMIDLEIGHGEFVAIMGPSGSGKSTLMNLLGLLDRPNKGRYLLAGEDVARISDDRRAGLRSRRIGFVFQSFNLIERASATENVELPLIYAGVSSRRRRTRAEGALAEVGLSERRHHRPRQLSGGEQQRVAIARALICEPDLVLADEPTGALDRRTGEQILDILRAVRSAGRTVVMVTHDREVAAVAERVVTLRDGRIVDDRAGLPAEGGA